MRIFFLGIALLTLALKASSSIFPDTLHISPIIITGERTVKETAGAITSSIDSSALVKSMTANLSDLILQNTPIFIKEYGRGAMATASFRGTAPSHTQVLWNGINLSSPMLGMVDFSTIPIYFIDNIQLLHGSTSLTENSGALGGIIKLQTHADFLNHFSGRMLTGIGSYGTQDEMIGFNLGNTKIQAQFRSFFNHSDNDFSFVNKFNADIDPNTGQYHYPTYKNTTSWYQNFGLLQELFYKPSEKDLISLHYWYQYSNRGLPKLLTDEKNYNSMINRQAEKAHRASLEWKHIQPKGIFSVNSGINVQLLNYWLGQQNLFTENSFSKVFSFYNKLNYEYHINNYLVNLGFDANLHQVNSDNTPFNSETYGYNKNRSENDVFLNITRHFGEKVSASFLGRQILIDGQLTPFIPSMGWEYKTYKGFFIKTNIAKNYHEPTLNDLYIIPGGNLRLKAEEGITADLGTGFSSKIGNASFKTSINGYYSKIHNWIIWIPKPYWTPQNLKTVEASGLEFKADLKGNFASYTYQITGIYAFCRSINKDDSLRWGDDSYRKQLPYIPVHSANLSVNLSQNGYHLNWSWSYYSQRYTTTTEDELDVIYPYIMNNLSVSKELKVKKNSFELELKILNLFDEQYRSVLQNPMPGRNYSLLFRYDF
jgi:iron complex outermembrane receptor protein